REIPLCREMWWAFFIRQLILIPVCLCFVYWRQHEEIAALKKAREKLELEETHVFDFLHGLGEAFSADIRRNDLPRMIVAGAINILNAQGGALYMASPDRTALLPRYIS